MEINRNNYEAFFLDYVEGNLSPEQEEKMHRFLKFNPDLSEELSFYQDHHLIPENIEYPEKARLKKQLPGPGDEFMPEHIELFCIAYLEGDLNPEQRKDFELFLSENPEQAKILEQYRFTQLPEEKIEFPLKAQLRKRKPVVFDWRVLVPVAAAAALLIFFLSGPQESTLPEEIADIREPEKTTEKVKEIIEEKKAELGAAPATLNVIRTKNVPVPVSGYKVQESKKTDDKQADDKLQKRTQVQRIAGLQLAPRSIKVPAENYDKITLQAIAPPELSSVSFSLADLARYQLQRASNLVENEDDLIFSLASAGLQELNRRVGTESTLLASRNDAGDISGIQFRSRYFNLTTPLSRGDDQ